MAAPADGLVAARDGPWQPGLHELVARRRPGSFHACPRWADGDRLLFAAPVDRMAAAGRVGVVRLPGGRPISIKRLTRREGIGGWWVERDNPDEGVDSWQVGEIPDGDLLGIVGRPAVAPAPARVTTTHRRAQLTTARPGSHPR